MPMLSTITNIMATSRELATSMAASVGSGAGPPSHREGRGYCAPAGVLIFSITWSRLKLAGFWRGGNSLKVARNSAT